MGLFHRKPRVRPDIIIKHVPFDVPGETPQDRESPCPACGGELDAVAACADCREGDRELFASMTMTNAARGPVKIVDHVSRRVPIGVTTNDAGEWESTAVAPMTSRNLDVFVPMDESGAALSEVEPLTVPCPVGPVASLDIDDLRAVIAEQPACAPSVLIESLRNKE